MKTYFALLFSMLFFIEIRASCKYFEHRSNTNKSKSQISNRFEKCKVKNWNYILDNKNLRQAEFKSKSGIRLVATKDLSSASPSVITVLDPNKKYFSIKEFRLKKRVSIQVFTVSEDSLWKCIKIGKRITKSGGCGK